MSIAPHSIQPVLHVTDVKAAIIYFTEVLGCNLDFVFEDRYAGLTFGKTCFHLSQGTGMFNRPVGGANVYFFLDAASDVDAAYGEIIGKGGKVNHEPQDYPYGMRDFVVFDPDGNMLTFGAESAH